MQNFGALRSKLRELEVHINAYLLYKCIFLHIIFYKCIFLHILLKMPFLCPFRPFCGHFGSFCSCFGHFCTRFGGFCGLFSRFGRFYGRFGCFSCQFFPFSTVFLLSVGLAETDRWSTAEKQKFNKVYLKLYWILFCNRAGIRGAVGAVKTCYLNALYLS